MALLIHVGTTDEFDTEVIANKLRGGNFHGNHVSHALGVGLVAVHDDHLVAFVKFVGHLLAERLNSVLDKSLFSINIKSTIALLCDLSNLTHATIEGIKALKIIGSEVSTLFGDLGLQISAVLSVSFEKVASNVPVNGCDVAVGI